MSWPEALEEIRSGTYRDSILRAREILTRQEAEAYKKLKKSLPGVTFSWVFSHRKNDGILLPTGIIVADIDGCDVSQIKETLSDDENIWFAFTSPGGEGIKAGLRAQGIKSDSDHKRFFSAVDKYFSEVYNITIDRACKDISRLTFLSYDLGAFINSDPTFFDIEAWAAENNPNRIIFPDIPVSSNGDGKEKYVRKLLQTACQKIRESTPGSMHATRLSMARLVGGYLHCGIDETEAMTALEKAVVDSGTNNFKSAMKTIRDGLANGKLSPVTIPEKQNNDLRREIAAMIEMDAIDREVARKDIAEKYGVRKTAIDQCIKSLEEE